MPRRSARGRMPLEWKSKYLAMDTSGTQAQGEIDLDLLPDEIAEIVKIDSLVVFEDGLDNTTSAVNECSFIQTALSMDPDFSTNEGILDPTDNRFEDLEVFFTHLFCLGQVNIATVANTFSKVRASETKISDFKDYPILVGTNVSMCSVFSATDSDTDASAFVTLYFKRRRANAQELNQILLKRR